MEGNAPDAEWIARSLGEPAAFEPIFQRHFDAVHSYLHRRAGRELRRRARRADVRARVRAPGDLPRRGKRAPLALRDRDERYEYLPRTPANLALTDIRAQHPDAVER